MKTVPISYAVVDTRIEAILRRRIFSLYLKNFHFPLARAAGGFREQTFISTPFSTNRICYSSEEMDMNWLFRPQLYATATTTTTKGLFIH